MSQGVGRMFCLPKTAWPPTWGIQIDIDSALAFEAEVFGECFSTEDQTEGMSAFVEKRDKSFKNR